MADMKKKNNAKLLSEEEIDQIVVAQAADDSAWEAPIHVRRVKSSTMRLPATLAARAAFFARLHHASSVDDWLKRIIEERIDFEEAAFTGLKRDLISKSRGKRSSVSR
jgi:hypothetical protein